MKLGTKLRICAVAGALAATTMPALADSGPFAGYSGSWSGGGTVSMSDGSKERLRCRATYRAATSTLQQTLRCASDSYAFELASSVAASGDRISGTWSEASRGVSGSLEGRASGGRIVVTVDSPAFTANLTVATHGNRQNVSITSQSEIRSIAIALTRS